MREQRLSPGCLVLMIIGVVASITINYYWPELLPKDTYDRRDDGYNSELHWSRWE
jgi:hypothetical protein